MSGPQAALSEVPSPSHKRIWIAMIAATCILLGAIGTSTVVLWKRYHNLQEQVNDAEFYDFVTTYLQQMDSVEPTVNEIQFMHKGYSIDFDSVQYTPAGLELSGDIGNPTQLWISSLALHFSARDFKIKDKWMEALKKEGGMPWWKDEWNLGSAETEVGNLNPGSTSHFQVTIPNVKQSSEKVGIVVWFSGERYQYLGGK